MPEKYYVDRHAKPLIPSGGIANLLHDGPNADGHFPCCFVAPDLGEVVSVQGRTLGLVKADPLRCVAYLRRHYAGLTAEWKQAGLDREQAWVVKLAARLALMNQ